MPTNSMVYFYKLQLQVSAEVKTAYSYNRNMIIILLY
jgi:hypothetical protein